MRDKWDKKDGAQTYGVRTINIAVKGLTETYSKPKTYAIEINNRQFISPLSNYKRYSLDDLGAARLFADTLILKGGFNYVDQSFTTPILDRLIVSRVSCK